MQQLEAEVRAGIALVTVAPDLDWAQRREVVEGLTLARALILDAVALLENAEVA